MDTSNEVAVCEYCNKTGLKSEFYSTTKRFCSAGCSHTFSSNHRIKSQNSATKTTKKRRLQLPSEIERLECISMGFDWGGYLVTKKAKAATVELFQHVPMASHWGEIGSGMKVEVVNLDCSLNTKVFWIASVVQVAGYKAKLRYEGFGDDATCDFWCNLCTLDVHAVGWCATIGKPLVPPQTIQHKYTNWKTFLVKRLTGAKTLPNDFHRRVVDSVKSSFLCSMRLEVVDKTKISRMRVGIIEEIKGNRLRLRYEDSDYVNDDFWCHAASALIHSIGWCEKVGHKILVVSKDYKTKKGHRNARQELFPPVRQVKSCGFKVGMKLEAIDPLNLSAICVATVKKVLKNGYLMIGIDGSEAADGSDWFCYHCTAPSIFPVGFCIDNGISLSVPKVYKDKFSWEKYLDDTQSQPAPVDLFDSALPDHGFVRGMKLEAVDLMEPRLICVATVTRIVGRLLHVHFDGWENQYDQWVDCMSPDIYPVGWCELVGYELQPPPNMQASDTNGAKKRKKLTGQSFIAKKKRKKQPQVSKKPESTADNHDSVEVNESEKMEVEEKEETQIDENANISKTIPDILLKTENEAEDIETDKKDIEPSQNTEVEMQEITPENKQNESQISTTLEENTPDTETEKDSSQIEDEKSTETTEINKEDVSESKEESSVSQEVEDDTEIPETQDEPSKAIDLFETKVQSPPEAEEKIEADKIEQDLKPETKEEEKMEVKNIAEGNTENKNTEITEKEKPEITENDKPETEENSDDTKEKAEEAETKETEEIEETKTEENSEKKIDETKD